MAILDPFWAKVFKSETTSFHYFSPKDSKNLKRLDIRLREVGAKRMLNGVRNCDGQTNRHTDISTIERIGPEGRFFENCLTESSGQPDLGHWLFQPLLSLLQALSKTLSLLQALTGLLSLLQAFSRTLSPLQPLSRTFSLLQTLSGLLSLLLALLGSLDIAAQDDLSETTPPLPGLQNLQLSKVARLYRPIREGFKIKI